MRRLLKHSTESSITPNSKERSVWRNKKPQKEDRFLRGRQIAYLIYEYFRVTGANDSVENYADLFTIVNTTPHTSHFLTDSHAHAWLKSCVSRARITCHDSSSCAHVFVLTLFDYSTSPSLLTIFSLIILSFLLSINFTFHDVVDKFPVHSR